MANQTKEKIVDMADRLFYQHGFEHTSFADIALYGCPVGTLTTELGKLSHPSLTDANKVFTLFKRWLEDQFKALGKNTVDAENLAMQLLARFQ